ncbi:right-handed parallel beta-helix repeat-containing protein [Actinomyces urogenitalis]|uniref:right-handed parallel beta-helix repeat-containing protein n=1 Tax=Actinomyces urogenitalis TaxID=103621 RepID=UPI00242BA86B|nr:right-handed parallel beta-helix repeat-containing protein [Actinomyces urogenitalis]MCI7456148.1 right-handed parallel beta-helix repeat-containing protein [Actinomyces urogenitalis]
MSPVLHVSPSGSDAADGSAEAPFRTINRAVAAAYPGDTVQIHEGVYREWVKPTRTGRSDDRRITFEAAPGEHAVIKGSEQVTDWVQEGGSDSTVWKAEVPNTLFGEFNPFAIEVEGDWTVYASRTAPRKHLGEVYLNGKSFYEVTSREEVDTAERRTEDYDRWTGVAEPVREPDQTPYVWFAEVGDEVTTIWANFRGADPRQELVEINVRRSVFYPTVHHVNYITVRGLELAQAATPWAPPTADQPGLIGPNWAKGWVIEDCDIHDAKCSAVSLGKENSSGHNWATERLDKPGYQYQLEAVYSAFHIGWSRDLIGSHVVRRNHIHDCGQNAVVGHLGCVFSTIEDNHIHHIATKHEFYGYEIAGIKLHAALDTVIRHNLIEECTLGIWLDWEAQGTRVTRNVFKNNARDLFIEVSHGPYVVDHNVFSSDVSLEGHSQGGAYVNNLVLGVVANQPIIERPTPYHLPHSTQPAGYAAIRGGDDRYIGNLFLSTVGEKSFVNPPSHRKISNGTALFDGHPAGVEAYLELVNDPSKGDHERFEGAPLPVFIRDNAYGNDAPAYESEERPVHIGQASAHLEAEGEAVYLVAELPEAIASTSVKTVAGADLGRAWYPDQTFENPDGSALFADVDLVGEVKDHESSYPAGPLASLKAGSTRVRVW